jgi:NADH:ubiquinone oxidoreductase subunit 6 (subunit J)
VVGAYTFWDAIWTMIVFFAYIMFFTWVVMLLVDNFRRNEQSGWAKAGWFVLIIFLPIIGAFAYTVARPESASDYYEAGFISAPSSGTSTAEELARLNELRADGAISDAEFEQLKQKTIAAS